MNKQHDYDVTYSMFQYLKFPITFFRCKNDGYKKKKFLPGYVYSTFWNIVLFS